MDSHLERIEFFKNVKIEDDVAWVHFRGNLREEFFNQKEIIVREGGTGKSVLKQGFGVDDEKRKRGKRCGEVGHSVKEVRSFINGR